MTVHKFEQKDKDPWTGNRKNEQGPPDLSKLFNDFLGKVKKQNNRSGGARSGGTATGPMGLWVGVFAFAIILIWALSGIFVVSPTDQSVVLRFGKYLSTAGPGPHWIPRLIDSQTTLNVQNVNAFTYSSEMLTEDENIVSVEVAVQFRIGNPRNYLYSVVSPTSSIQQATSSALRQVIGDNSLDSILTTGRSKVRDDVQTQLEKTLAFYHTGLMVTDVTLLPAKPPAEVTAAFDDAIKAREDEQKYENQAQAYARKKESIAAGQVSRLLQDAKAYQQQVLLQAKAHTASYKALLKPFALAPSVTESRIYFDTIADVLSKTTNILDDTGGHNVLYLPVDKLSETKKSDESDTTQDSSTAPKEDDDTTASMAAKKVTPAVLPSLGYPTRPAYNPYGGA